jgi:cell division protein FtsW (lipid II flippase)
MTIVIIEITKYLMIIMMAVYTFQSFAALRSDHTDADRSVLYQLQRYEIFLIQFMGFLDLYIVTQELKVLIMGAAVVLLYVFIELTYGLVYKNAPKLLLNNMCMLLSISFIILSRLNIDNAMKQLMIAIVAAFGTILIPFLIEKLSFLDRLTYFYAFLGIGALGAVAAMGAVSYGAKLAITVGGISLQPSEFIKIVFVFYVASTLNRSVEFQHIVKATIVAALHVLILVASKDLGAALLFFMVYLVMLYVATRKLSYFFTGLAAGALASVGAYFVFAHVRTRVIAWKDPFAVIDGAGYQVSQSLFAIGSGGWFGTGLYQGLPTSIPVVQQDFIFSAISEEMGGIVAVCLVLLCMCCFFIILNIAMKIHRTFYKLIALGLGTVYIFQVFLTVGGVTKFIPSTGVTLPFVSYGGSSLLSSFIIFNIILGLYLFKEKEESGIVSKKKEKTGRKEKRRQSSARTEVSRERNETQRRRGGGNRKREREIQDLN